MNFFHNYEPSGRPGYGIFKYKILVSSFLKISVNSKLFFGSRRSRTDRILFINCEKSRFSIKYKILLISNTYKLNDETPNRFIPEISAEIKEGNIKDFYKAILIEHLNIINFFGLCVYFSLSMLG
jgi:hypothetical protein